MSVPPLSQTRENQQQERLEEKKRRREEEKKRRREEEKKRRREEEKKSTNCRTATYTRMLFYQCVL